MKIVEVDEIVASGTPTELLAWDENAPHMCIADHPVWRAALAGELPADRLRGLVKRVYPVVAGPGRYAFIAKIGVIDDDDGTRLFDRLYRVTHDANSDADVGWRRMGEAMRGFDLIATPTVATPAPVQDAETMEIGGTRTNVREALLRATRIFNISRQPAVAVPCGFSDDGLPLSLQIAAPAFEDARVLRAAHAYQETTDWHRRRAG